MLPLLTSLFTSLLFVTQIKFKKKTFPVHICPQIFSVFFPSLFCGVWGSAAGDPCSIHTEQWLARLPRGPVWSSACVLALTRTDQVSQGESTPTPHPITSTFLSVLFPLSNVSLSLTTSQPEQNTKVNHHHLPWTLCYTPKETREREGCYIKSLSRQVVTVIPLRSQWAICFKHRVVLCHSFPTQTG